MRKERGSFYDEKIISDPNGSYTGQPQEVQAQPIQDADDL